MLVRTASPAAAGEAPYSAALATREAAEQSPPPSFGAAVMQRTVDLHQSAGYFTLDLPDRKSSPPGKLGVACAVEPRGEEYLSPPAWQRAQGRIEPSEKLGIGRL